jgi:5-formyltetrahydrofolate cyclo-ligase
MSSSDPAPTDPGFSGDPAAAKRALRQRMLAAREAWDPQAAGAGLLRQVLAAMPPPPGAVVSGFWPIGQEIDIRPLLQALHARGHPIALPITPRRGNPLTFGLWQPGDVLQPERFGTSRPIGPPAVPDFLLVPLLAFDRRGNRLGYGAGFYDRTLAGLPPGRFALGVAYAAQCVPTVPAGPTDMRLDAIATEAGVIRREDD